MSTEEIISLKAEIASLKKELEAEKAARMDALAPIIKKIKKIDKLSSQIITLETAQEQIISTQKQVNSKAKGTAKKVYVHLFWPRLWKALFDDTLKFCLKHDIITQKQITQATTKADITKGSSPTDAQKSTIAKNLWADVVKPTPDVLAKVNIMCNAFNEWLTQNPTYGPTDTNKFDVNSVTFSDATSTPSKKPGDSDLWDIISGTSKVEAKDSESEESSSESSDSSSKKKNAKGKKKGKN